MLTRQPPAPLGKVNGHDLVMLVSHWTSRRTDDNGPHRAKYGDQVYGVFKGMHGCPVTIRTSTTSLPAWMIAK